MEWLISANSRIYNHKASFKDHGFIDWHQVFNYSVGDIIYIYGAKPDSKILFKTIVQKINMKFDSIRDDKEYWTDLNSYEKSKSGRFCRIKLLEENEGESLSLRYLLENGLKKAPQGAVKLNSQLKKYIETNFVENFEIEYPDDMEVFTEGNTTQVLVNKYERNQQARKKCIDYYGYKCKVCGFDFEKKYGEIGKNYIHVHHVVPIHEIKKDYDVNPITDLIPVCPNCHAMLHRKNKFGEFYDIQTLKKHVMFSN